MEEVEKFVDLSGIINYDKALLFVGIFVGVCILVIAAIMIDLWDGVYTAKATGERVHSHKLRVTIKKMSEYWRFIIIAFIIDCLGFIFNFYLMPYVVLAFGVGLIIVEVKSMFEHARKRRSEAAHLTDIISKIVKAETSKEAKNVLSELLDYLNNNDPTTKQPNDLTT